MSALQEQEEKEKKDKEEITLKQPLVLKLRSNADIEHVLNLPHIPSMATTLQHAAESRLLIVWCNTLQSQTAISSSRTGFVNHSIPVAYPGIFFREGVQQIQLRTEDRENGDLGA